MPKRALLTGITGQDGSYLAELLLDKNYEVFGLHAQRATPNTRNIAHLLDRITLIPGDVGDQASIDKAVEQSQPDEVYNLGAQSFVKTSWDLPEATSNVNALGPLRVLEAVRRVKPQARFYQASTSEIFGKVQQVPQTERTPFYPRSPYGVAKLYGHWITVNYRESYGMFACSGILFNHGSPRRGEQFVEQKITQAAVRIALGLQDKLVLGNTKAQRDMGHAADYVRAMWLMLQQDQPDDYVIATGQTHSIQDIVEFSFGYLDLDWHQHVQADHPDFTRPAEVDLLLGDPTKAKTRLQWTPKYSFESMLIEMIEHHQQAYRQMHPAAADLHRPHEKTKKEITKNRRAA
jgi:GDPmannose 4,6-dehydratase